MPQSRREGFERIGVSKMKHSAVAYGKCGHSSYGCTCPYFDFDPELTGQKDDEAREWAEQLRADLIRDSHILARR